jgi:23S rRNA pseudouridine2605 synthase
MGSYGRPIRPLPRDPLFMAYRSPQRHKPGKKPRPARPSRRPAKWVSGPPAKARPGATEGPGEASSGQRLQKVLAAAGAGSRRQCEELILSGRVEVDRQMVTELGTRVDPDHQEIRLDGVPLRQAKRVYYAVHKPTGVVSTSRDPAGRPRVTDLLPKSPWRLFAVGRLDLNSEGLILLTNDGELANRLTHPRYGVEKTYRVQVAGHPEPQVLTRLREGVRLAEGIARVARVKVTGRHKESTILEMVLDEGRNREIRRVLARVGHKVLRLVRVGVGPVRLGTLAPGQFRPLTRQEVEALRKAARKSARNA